MAAAAGAVVSATVVDAAAEVVTTTGGSQPKRSGGRARARSMAIAFGDGILSSGADDAVVVSEVSACVDAVADVILSVGDVLSVDSAKDACSSEGRSEMLRVTLAPEAVAEVCLETSSETPELVGIVVVVAVVAVDSVRRSPAAVLASRYL